MRRAAALASVALLAGCASAPTRFFTLDPTQPDRPITTAFVSPIQLDSVRIPSVLDRPELVTEPSVNHLRISDQDHWGAPLGELIRRTLAQDLVARLPAGAVVLPDAPPPAGVRGLVVDILQLQADPTGHVYIQASWTLLGAGSGRTMVTREVQLAVDAPTTAATDPSDRQAAALSRLLGELADDIAVKLPAAGARHDEPRSRGSADGTVNAGETNLEHSI